MNHKIAYEEINYENSDYELDVWSSCFNPIFNPPPEVIEEWNHRFDDEWKEVTLSDVLQRMGVEFHKCRPGFTPAQNDRYMCIAEYYNGSDDYRLFYLGQELKSIEQDKLSFSELSHA